MKTKFILILAVVVLTLASCIKSDDTFDVQSDIYFVTKYVDNVPVTGTAYIFLGNHPIDSTVVTLPGNSGTVNLKSSTSDYTLIKEPTDSQYYATPPVSGNYSFEVTSDLGQVYIGFENQEYIDLAGADISSFDFNSSYNALHLEWNKITQCNEYGIKIFDSSDNLIFNSNFLSSDVTTLDVSTYNESGVWNEIPVNGETYKIKIYTYLYDSGAATLNNALDLQQVTYREYQVTWAL